MKRIWTVIALVAALFAILAVRLLKPAPVNLLLVTLDTTRADRLGCYGFSGALTPALDRLARQGTLFENAYCATPITLPSHATIFTGLQSAEHGLRINGEGKLDPSIPTLARILKSGGFSTGAFVASFVLDSRFGLDAGFDAYDDEIGGGADREGWLERERSGDQVVDRALSWLESRADEPFFCWVHLFDPHFPYYPHEETFGARFLASPYDGEVAFMDRQVGRLAEFLAEQGLDRRTLVIVAGDHGESLGEHGEQTHGYLLYNGALRVPLIAHLPGRVPAGQRVREAVSLADVFPTVLDFVVGRRTGRGFARALKGRRIGSGTCYAETSLPFLQFGWSPMRAVVEGNLKLIEGAARELYDLERDPKEKDNIVHSRARQADAMVSVMAGVEAGLRHHAAAAVRLTPEDERILTSLGYASGLDSTRKPAPEVILPDVRDRIGLLDDVNRARQALSGDHAEEALSLAQNAVAHDPGNVEFELVLAAALGAAGRRDEAARILETIRGDVDRFVPTETWLSATILLASCRMEAGKADEAASLLREVLSVDESHPSAMNSLAWYLATRRKPAPGSVEEAVRMAETVVGSSGRKDPAYLDTLAAAYAAAGRYEDAAQAAQEALALIAGATAERQETALRKRLARYRKGKRYVE